jgi:amino-acid N-acetyltransferase
VSVEIREARTSDVQVIRRLVDDYSSNRILLSKATVTLFEDIQEFYVAEFDGEIVGCGGLHVLWEDLAEVRTLVVDKNYRGKGIGDLLLRRLLQQARHVGVSRVFCLTFEVDFFSRHGFSEIVGAPVSHEVFEQLLESYDEGVAEFLDLERVKPNTLGNVRMLLVL